MALGIVTRSDPRWSPITPSPSPIGLGQALVAIDHQLRAEGVIGLTCGFKRRRDFKIFGERKVPETVRRTISKSIFMSRGKKTSPKLVQTTLKHGKRRQFIKKYSIVRTDKHDLCVDEIKSEMRRGKWMNKRTLKSPY